MTTVRDYRPEDEAGVLACLAELQESERGFEGMFKPGDEIAKTHLDYILSQCGEEGKLFVAECDGAVAGVLTAWRQKDAIHFLFTKPTYLYVSELIVLPQYRGQGVGKALLDRAEIFAKECGESQVMLHVLEKNDAARAVYEKQGYRPYNRLLTKEL